MTTVNLTIAADVNNYDIYVQAGSPAGIVDVTVTINAGVVVGGASGVASMFQSGSFAAGSTVTITNNGTIAGRGGDGGDGGAPGGSGGHDGKAGKTGLQLGQNTTLINNGNIYGGGGGGGGGGTQLHGSGGGGGGGGGQGQNGGNKGAKGSSGAGAATNGTFAAHGNGGSGASTGGQGGGDGGSFNTRGTNGGNSTGLGGVGGDPGSDIDLNGFSLVTNNTVTAPLGTLTLTGLIPTFNVGGGMTAPLGVLTLTGYTPVAMGAVASATSYSGAGARGRLSKPPFNEGIPDTIWNWHLKTWRWSEGESKPEVSKTASFTASDAFLYPVDATAGSIVVTLPKAATMGGKKFVVKKTDASANTVTVTADTLLPDLVDGAATKVLTAQYDTLVVQADGVSNWWKLSASATAGGGTGTSIYYNVMDYGAVGDGTTDDTAAFQAAHDAMVTSGGTVYAPSNTYNIAGTLNFSKSMTFLGDGFGSTILSKGAGTGDMFSMTGTFQRLSGFKILAGTTQTADAYIHYGAASARQVLDNFYLDGWFIGVLWDGIASMYVGNGFFFSGVPSTGTGIYIHGGTAADLHIDSCVWDGTSVGANMPSSGIRIDQCADIRINNCEVIRQTNGLAVLPSTSQVVASLWVSHSHFDNCNSRGVLIRPAAASGSIVRSRFDNCWTSSCATGSGMLINGNGGTINGMDISNHHAFLNDIHGIQVTTATVLNVHILGGEFAQNGTDGIQIAGQTDFSIIGVRSGNCSGLTGNGGWGINVTASGSNNYRILNNDLRGNTSGALFDAGVSPKVALNNLPWDTSCPSQFISSNSYFV